MSQQIYKKNNNKFKNYISFIARKKLITIWREKEFWIQEMFYLKNVLDLPTPIQKIC